MSKMGQKRAKKTGGKKAHPHNGSFSTRLLSTLRLLGSSCWQKLGPVQDIFSLPNFSKSQTDLEKEKEPFVVSRLESFVLGDVFLSLVQKWSHELLHILSYVGKL